MAVADGSLLDLTSLTNNKPLRNNTEICTDIPDIPCDNRLLHIYSSGCNRSMFLCLPCVIMRAQPCFYSSGYVKLTGAVTLTRSKFVRSLQRELAGLSWFKTGPYQKSF